MSQQIPEAEGHEKLVANRFGVATQDTPVATRTRMLHQILLLHYQSLSRHNPIKSSENRPRHKTTGYDKD